ncbi:hypothetical protein R1sor_000221 [Riccia sorocarpa]|uniref:Germin-like protein n=1 Tax=Riccia sorocarpa TaxID=122646 RepID=A0ABD3GV00_9MARC
MAVYSLHLPLSGLLMVLLIVAFSGSPVGADPDIVRAFGIPVNSSNDIHFTGFRDLPPAPADKVDINFAFDTQFPGVTGQGLAVAYLRFGPNSINPFHSHPRASEIFYIIEGELHAGLVDEKFNLYTATLKKNDLFVFPRGLMHFQINLSKTKGATVLAAFGSENAGRVSFPPAIFNTNPSIETEIIARSLGLDQSTVERLKKSVAMQCIKL